MRNVAFDDLTALDISQPQPLSRCIQGFHAPAIQETSAKKILDFHIQMDWTDSWLSKQKRPRNEDNWLADWKELLDKSGYLKK